MKTLRMLLVGAVAAACAFGCASVPHGYDADLTPGHNGETWVGGAAIQGYTADARAAMQAHLQEESWCAWCGRTTALEVHHAWPVSRRPDLAAEPSNMVTLCHACHRYVAHPGGDSKKWISNIRQLCNERFLCGPGTDAP